MELELYYTVLLIIFLSIWWYNENRRHKEIIKKVKYRIHVNGTRGKSSVTRLIAGIFREAGYKTLAKTTGSMARIIFPDGHEEAIQRRGGANIKEQIKIIGLAARMDVDVIVLECMALQPHYIKITEEKMVQATSAVLTNTRPDHLDVQGPTPLDVVDALSGMIPRNGKLYTSEKINLDRLRQNAKKINAEIISSEDIKVKESELAAFDHIEHHDNVTLALKVALAHGIDRDTAFRGMVKATPDPGALVLYHMERNEKKIIFANAFAANDPESNKLVWEILKARFSKEQKFVVINNRADRQTRTIQLAEFVSHIDADHFYLVGTGTDILKGLMKKNGIGAMKYSDFSGKPCEALFDDVAKRSEEGAFVVGMGNIGGVGHEYVQFCEIKRDNLKQGG